MTQIQDSLSSTPCLAVILAAGEGTRMRSQLPKVLHEIAHLPMICHVVRSLQQAGSDKLAVIVGRGAEQVRQAVVPFAENADFFEQTERLGTAHAVLHAESILQDWHDDVLIVYGDTPLIRPQALQLARQNLHQGADLVVMGFHTDTPQGYGRLIVNQGQLVAIVEEKDATEQQRQIQFCNGGLMAVKGRYLHSLLKKIGNDNAKGEYYLTDIVALAHDQGLNVQALDIDAQDLVGVNSRAELAEAESIWQKRRRHELLLSGVTMIDPQSVWLAWDTEIDKDVVLEPHVVFGPKVKIESDVTIHAFSHIEGAMIASGAQIGPFARLRSGTDLAENTKVGNFCEVKNAKVGQGAKINHLSYIGDAQIGADTNIGAGTITCNYDGFNKWKTVIGDNVFIGSNSSLVAPVTINHNAFVGSGSVIVEDVPIDALALGRARQVNKPERARDIRERNQALKNELKNKLK